MKDSGLHEKIQAWLSEPLPGEVRASLNRLASHEDVRHMAVMPDVHLAHHVCVGTVMATATQIFPAAIGGDIGCGMLAVALNADADRINNPVAAAKILSGLYECVPAGRHRRSHAVAALPEELCKMPLSHPRLETFSRRDGRVQLGTLGRGNHFVEFQADPENRLWLMLHSGSRGMGQAITAHHLSVDACSSNATVAWDAESRNGAAYLTDMRWAVAYAQQNRLAMMTAIGRLLQEEFAIDLQLETLVHCDHNHVRQETHFGRELWVHRKGALPATAGEQGVIPGSMGTRSFHVVGRGCAEALQSSSHGAGRALSRHDARRVIGQKKLEREMRDVWIDRRRMEKFCEEAPSAYKEIGRVMRAQRALTRIKRELQPVLCYKGT